MTLADCLENNNLLPRYVQAPDLFLIFGEQERLIGLQVVSHLRKGGYSTTYPLKPIGFGKQFKEAGKSGARFALVLGEEEAAKKEVKVKDLINGKEKSCPISNLLSELDELDSQGGLTD